MGWTEKDRAQRGAMCREQFLHWSRVYSKVGRSSGRVSKRGPKPKPRSEATKWTQAREQSR
eukprot:1625149-Lingulodinium_polyedra.AAC.1